MIKENLIVLSRDTKITNKKTSFKTWSRNWKKKTKSERVTLWIMLVVFLIYGFTLMFPLYWAVINSFKPVAEYKANSFAWPSVWTLENYQELFEMMETSTSNIFEAIWNSVWMSTVSTLLGLIASSLTAYVVSKYRFKMSGFIYAAVILIQVIPLVGSITGMYQLVWRTLEIGDKPLLIWPIWFGGFGFSFLLLYSAFKSVPWSYAESAFIDGAGHFKTFVRIMLPQVKPVLASLFVVNFIGAWNDYMTAYLYLPSHQTLALAVYELQNDASRISVPAYLAVVVISIAPILILFVSFQKIIMENTNAGGLKG
ncbi:MAG: carbohydrate ABC transporter permease [Bacilli bacterium]|nr:carbohydrate ABC transporter permease [Bacilli bacterium]